MLAPLKGLNIKLQGVCSGITSFVFELTNNIGINMKYTLVCIFLFFILLFCI